MENYTNLNGQECVAWIDEDGTTHSMLKSAYDEMIAQNEASTL
jgi:hypothetical protein